MQKIDKNSLKKLINPITFFVIIPVALALGVFVFEDRSYAVVSAMVAVFACLPAFIWFEKRQKTARELMVVAVLTGFSVLGRLVFAPIPAFKPVTAIVIIAALSLGRDNGFIIGAFSAIVSNFYFGQGPWTPFQMLSWGLVGYFAGLFEGSGLAKKWWVVCILGIFGGIIYSLMMDIWTVLAIDASFSLAKFWTAILASLPWMAAYCASNIVFLLFLTKPFTQKLQRLKTKFQLFQ